MQEEQLALEIASKSYLQRLAVIWSSPLSDHNKVTASNQYAFPGMGYLMWTLKWPINDLKSIDRQARQIIVNGGGKHPAGSTALLYLSRDRGGRGLRSVEQEYKNIKIKAALKLCNNPDASIQLVKEFEERSVKLKYQSILKDSVKFATEIGLNLSLDCPVARCYSENGEEIPEKKIKTVIREACEDKLLETVRGEKWQGKFLSARHEDQELKVKSCFAWLNEWPACATYTAAGMFELYEQLLPTKIYSKHKTRVTLEDDVVCRLCNKAPETIAHVLAGCSALAQNKYLERHNAALKVLFYEVLHDLKLLEDVPPWYSPLPPKPHYESSKAEAFWDIPVYAEHHEVRSNRVDARIVDHVKKKVLLIEMSCPWIDNRGKKDEEKTLKYGPLRWELKQRYPEYKIEQTNVIIDVLGGWSEAVERDIIGIVGEKASKVLKKMQRSIISSSLNIARTFKVLT